MGEGLELDRDQREPNSSQYTNPPTTDVNLYVVGDAPGGTHTTLRASEDSIMKFMGGGGSVNVFYVYANTPYLPKPDTAIASEDVQSRSLIYDVFSHLFSAKNSSTSRSSSLENTTNTNEKSTFEDNKSSDISLYLLGVNRQLMEYDAVVFQGMPLPSQTDFPIYFPSETNPLRVASGKGLDSNSALEVFHSLIDILPKHLQELLQEGKINKTASKEKLSPSLDQELEISQAEKGSSESEQTVKEKTASQKQSVENKSSQDILEDLLQDKLPKDKRKTKKKASIVLGDYLKNMAEALAICNLLNTQMLIADGDLLTKEGKIKKDNIVAQSEAAQRKYEKILDQIKQKNLMKWLGPLLTVLMTLIAIVGAIFTGGASLALIAISVSLCTLSVIDQTTHFSEKLFDALGIEEPVSSVIKMISIVIITIVTMGAGAAGGLSTMVSNSANISLTVGIASTALIGSGFVGQITHWAAKEAGASEEDAQTAMIVVSTICAIALAVGGGVAAARSTATTAAKTAGTTASVGTEQAAAEATKATQSNLDKFLEMTKEFAKSSKDIITKANYRKILLGIRFVTEASVGAVQTSNSIRTGELITEIAEVEAFLKFLKTIQETIDLTIRNIQDFIQQLIRAISDMAKMFQRAVEGASSSQSALFRSLSA